MRHPGVATGQVVHRLSAVGVFCAASRADDGILHIGPFANCIGHVTVLALGNIVVGIGGVELAGGKGSNARCTSFLAKVGQHELGKGSFHVEVGIRRIGLGGQRLRAQLAQVGQHGIGHVVAGTAKVLALVIAAVEHGVPPVGVGEGGPLVAVRTDEILPATVLNIGRAGRKVVLWPVEGRAVEQRDALG